MPKVRATPPSSRFSPNWVAANRTDFPEGPPLAGGFFISTLQFIETAKTCVILSPFASRPALISFLIAPRTSSHIPTSMATPDLILLHAPSVYDFRREAILYGPVSDLVPSTPVFEMYPIGFTTMAEYLERAGLRTRIINLAVRMLKSQSFDVETYLKRLDAMVFGIDLHWLPHAHGSVEIARLLKRLHPQRPVLFGGFSASYFHQELIRYPAVDFILRGDSTEAPLLTLMQYLRSGGPVHPSPGSPIIACCRASPTWSGKTATCSHRSTRWLQPRFAGRPAVGLHPRAALGGALPRPG